MGVIRVGIIGLSAASSGVNWAGRAHLPYLLSEHGRQSFDVFALCNTSVESAKRSVEQYKLPNSTKAYGSVDDLAADPDVDLVVNVTGVELHHKVLLPVLKAKKNVFTELPLASNMTQMNELLTAVQDAKVDNVFGMQGQTSPVVKAIKDIIAQDKIGKVLSSTWTGAAMQFGEKPMPIGLKYFTQRKAGGNLMTIGFLHSINYIIATLGDIDTFNSILGNQRPSTTLMDPKQGGKVVETVQKETPDQVLFQGRFCSGALLSYHLRGGEPFPGEKGLVWSIYGEKGEIRIICPVYLLDISHDGVEMRLHTFEDGQAQSVKLPKDELTDLPHPAQNVGRIYAAYAKGKKGGEEGYPDWEEGMRRHRLIEAMWKQADGPQPFGAAM